MRATRRRRRKVDPLASREAVRSVVERLRAALPGLIPQKEKELVRLLRAARHAQRYPATETRRGRPGRWPREELLRVVARLEEILGRETASHISPASFVDHYLRLLDFPSDVAGALEDGRINLFEAEQLARVTARRLGVSPSQAKRTRTDISLRTYRQEPRVSGSVRGSRSYSVLYRQKRERLAASWILN